MIPSGAVFVILAAAVLLAAALAWAVALMYQRRMLALMRAGAASGEAEAIAMATAAAAPRPAWSDAVNLAANRRASVRLLLRLAAESLLIALSQSALALLFVYQDSRMNLNRLLVLAAIYAWPAVLAWGLARRWRWRRILGGIAAYMLVMLLLVMARSTAAQSVASVGGWLASQVAIPITMTLLIGASGRVRAVAPYLLPPALLLSGASVLALQFMAQRVYAAPPWIIALVEFIGATPTLLLIALGPWLLLAWPVARLGQWLARAYRAKRFSDLSYLIATYWFVILFCSAVPSIESAGLLAFVQLLPWLWLLAPRAASSPPAAPPTLLVLRVFQRDAQVELLFDQVIERWRMTGNTVLIAGTDLLSRTLDPDDLFVYLNGALAERFIANPQQLAERIAGFDWRPDPDGRYRINECYCFDSTWQSALRALVECADVVLMDLRGFRAENRGCRFELGVLSAASHLRRVVVLHDRETARAVAEAEITAATVSAGHFDWLAADRLDGALAGRVLAALFRAAR